MKLLIKVLGIIKVNWKKIAIGVIGFIAFLYVLLILFPDLK